MNHNFNIIIAKDYDVNMAIIINNFDYWLSKNKANNQNNHEGKYWTYNSVKAFSLLFPYWSEKQIRTIIKKMIDKGILDTGNYNKAAYDRTLWYTFTDNFIKTYSSILLYGQMEVTERSNQIDQKGKPIPYIKPDIKLNTIIEQEKNLVTTSKTKNEPTLYKTVESIFLSKNNNRFDNYGIEGKAIKSIINKSAERDITGVFLQRIIETFFNLTENGNDYWRKQPFLPSVLNANGIFPRVEKEMPKEVERKIEVYNWS